MTILCLIGQYWIISFEEMLRRAGFQGQFLVFHSVSEAQEYVRTHPRVDFYLIEDSVVVDNDGMEWANELHKNQEDVLVLAVQEKEGGPPRFSKLILSIGERSLLAKVHEIRSTSKQPSNRS